MNDYRIFTGIPSIVLLGNEYECAMDQVLYVQNGVAAMPGAGWRCVLFSFARQQHLPARIDIAAIVYTKWHHGCRLKIMRSNRKSDSVSACSFEQHSGKISSGSDLKQRSLRLFGFFVKWCHGRHLLSMMSYLKSDSVIWCIITLGTSCLISSQSDLKHRSFKLFLWNDIMATFLM